MPEKAEKDKQLVNLNDFIFGRNPTSDYKDPDYDIRNKIRNEMEETNYQTANKNPLQQASKKSPYAQIDLALTNSIFNDSKLILDS